MCLFFFPQQGTMATLYLFGFWHRWYFWNWSETGKSLELCHFKRRTNKEILCIDAPIPQVPCLGHSRWLWCGITLLVLMQCASITTQSHSLASAFFATHVCKVSLEDGHVLRDMGLNASLPLPRWRSGTLLLFCVTVETRRGALSKVT